MSTQFKLLSETRFKPFFMTQFLGAFNDNVFKTALITLVAFQAASMTSMDGATLATILPGIFILPFVLFSATAGQLADKFEKSTIMKNVKLLEIGIMLLASLGFFMHNIWMLGSSLFLMGVHSTLFGPVKYSYLPQHLSKQELIGGNGLVESGSFVAIILGQVLGAFLASQAHHELATSVAIVAISVLGFYSSTKIPNSPAADPNLKLNWNPITETIKNVKLIWAKQETWMAIVANSWFWFFGATLLAQFPTLAKETFHGVESDFITMLSLFSVGIGIGSLLCEKLSKGSLELGLVALGAIGMTLFGIDLSVSSAALGGQVANLPMAHAISWFSNISSIRVLADVMLLGIFGGFFIVPLYVLLQTRVDPQYQSRIIAANNIMNALFMVASAGFSLAVFSKGASISGLFLATAILNVVIFAYLCVRQPEYFNSFIVWIKSLTSTKAKKDI